MFFPLMITELVKAVERLVSLAVTVVDIAGILRGEVHFSMATEITGTGEGFGTACEVAGKDFGIGLGTCGMFGSGGGRSGRIGELCSIRLGFGICSTIHSKISSRVRREVREANEVAEIKVAKEIERLMGDIVLVLIFGDSIRI